MHGFNLPPSIQPTCRLCTVARFSHLHVHDHRHLCSRGPAGGGVWGRRLAAPAGPYPPQALRHRVPSAVGQLPGAKPEVGGGVEGGWVNHIDNQPTELKHLPPWLAMKRRKVPAPFLTGTAVALPCSLRRSQEAWSGDEDEALRRLVGRHGERQWGVVSAELAAATGGALRPPLACLQRWRQLAAVPAKEGRLLGAQPDLIGDALTRLSGLVVKHGNSWKVRGKGGDIRSEPPRAICTRHRPLHASVHPAHPVHLSAHRLPVPPCVPFPVQRIADEYGGGWEPDQLMHIWRRHAQRGQQARRGKWTPEEDESLLKVRWSGYEGGRAGGGGGAGFL